MQAPFFSIILPTYNRAKLLPETIRSVINQTFTNWELLVVDDGSIDDTKEVIEGLNNNQVKYIYQTNQERSAARNNGIKNALGQYICFLDSDDLFEPNHLQVLFDYVSIHQNPIELIFTNCFYLINEKKEIANLPSLQNDVLPYLLQNPIVPARVCIHQKILKEFQFREDIVIVEDTVLWISIANKYPVKHIEVSTVQYRIYEGNSVNVKYNAFKPRLEGLRKLFKNKEISAKIGKKLIRETLSNSYYGSARHFEHKGMFLKMIWNLFISFVYHPTSNKNKSKLYMVYKFHKNFLYKILTITLLPKDKTNHYQMLARNTEWQAIKDFIPHGSKFLDVGCGAGYSMKRAEEDCHCNVFGIDPEPMSHGVGRIGSNYKIEMEKITRAVSESIPFENENFDVVYSSHVLEHVTSEMESLNEMKRVLKDDGVLIIGVPTATMASINWFSNVFFLTHIKIFSLLFQKIFNTDKYRWWELFIPASHSHSNRTILYDLKHYRVKAWNQSISRVFKVEKVILPCLYPYPEFVQPFKIRKTKHFSSSVFFICKKA